MAHKKNPTNGVALASLTSADGVARNGATLITNSIKDGTLSAFVTATIVTGSVVATIKWQVSADNSTFYDVRDLNNTAPTTITATASRVIPAPAVAMGWEYARVVVTLSGAATAAGDLTVANYHYVPYDGRP
jgi:hypothetical protein